jgi:hypothetical protein
MKPNLLNFGCLICLLFFTLNVKSETLLILERSGTLTFTQALTQVLQQTTFDTTVHIGYVDAFYASLSENEKRDASTLFYKSIMLSAGIENTTNITRIISQGSASGMFLESQPNFFPNAERIFTHILWQPKTGTLIPSDIDLAESLEHIVTMFPSRSQLLLIGNYAAFSSYLTTSLVQENQNSSALTIIRSDYKVQDIVDKTPIDSYENTVALLTHPSETQSELTALQWLKDNDIPVLYMFASENDLLKHKSVGGLIVSPLKMASLITKIINRVPLTPQDYQV